MMVYIPKGVPVAWGKGPKGISPGLVCAAAPMEAGPDDNVTYAEYCRHFHQKEDSMGDHSLKFFFDDLIPKERPSACLFVDSSKERYAVKRILKSGPYTHVFWADGTKTTVRRSPDEPDNDYAAFTAALAIKLYGSNSALKRMLKQKVEVQKPKGKKQDAQTYKAKSFFDLCHDQNRERVNLRPLDDRNEQKDCGECCPIDTGAADCTDTCPIDYEAIERNLKNKQDAT